MQIIKSTPFQLRLKAMSLTLLTPETLQRTKDEEQDLHSQKPCIKYISLLLPREPFSFCFCSWVLIKAKILDKECYPNKFWLWALKNRLPMFPGQNNFCHHFPFQTIIFQAKVLHWYNYLAKPKSRAKGLHSNLMLLGPIDRLNRDQWYTVTAHSHEFMQIPQEAGVVNFCSSLPIPLLNPSLFSRTWEWTQKL